MLPTRTIRKKRPSDGLHRGRALPGPELSGPARRLPMLLLWILVAAVGCGTPPAVFESPVPLPERFSKRGLVEQPAEWWRAFDDSQLNALMEEAFEGNLSLRVAWHRLGQAAAIARESAADFYPDVSGEASASRTGSRVSGNSSYLSGVALGVAASYEVDFWGRVKSSADAVGLDYEASREDLAAAAITLSARVVRTWFLMREQVGQIELLDEQIETNEQMLEVITLRFRRGQGSAIDVLQQRQLVELRKGDRVQVASNLKVLGHLLAVLLGRAPESPLPEPEGTIPRMAALPQTGLPGELVAQRPDVKAAFLRVRSADRRVAAAIAERFPTLRVTGRLETSGPQANDLFENWFANIAAGLVGPIFDGYRREARVERRRAILNESLALYGEAILRALREVEDALSREEHQVEFLSRLERQVELSSSVIERSRDNYFKGVLDYLRVLDALRLHQALQRRHLAQRLQLVGFRIDLHRALAGGWLMKRPEAEGTNQADKQHLSETGKDDSA